MDEHSLAKSEAQLTALLVRIQASQEHFGIETPTGVDASTAKDAHGDVADWTTICTDLRQYERGGV